jgi:hypothetical protein
MMTDQLLWKKIEAFEIDDITSSFCFSDRLARENSWSIEFTLRAIHEYKKFMYLVSISDIPQTPSDEIDQVWHLHLLYTQSYWIEFCKNTLNQSIHHGPTKGIEEKKDFELAYQGTLDFYLQEFNQPTPIDLWPTVKNRFKYINYTRVNKHSNWVFPKFNFFRS